MRPLYIFDLDGTLANIEHRTHFIQGQKKDWDAFFLACDQDEPIRPVIELLLTLRSAGAEVWLWTGRSEIARVGTISWLRKHGIKRMRDERSLLMRGARDFRPDHELKQEWLMQLPYEDRARLVGVFDDRQAVVDMWRANKIQCFQVAPGDF